MPRKATVAAESELWFIVDMDDGVVAVATTRREAMRLAGVPTRSEWRGAGHWEHHRYGPDIEEIGWAYGGDDSMESVGIEHGSASAERQGWGWALAEWREAGSPVGVVMDDEQTGDERTAACTCSPIRIGTEVTEARNWNPDCSAHGVESTWWHSPAQVAKRSADAERLRTLQAQAALARRLARDGVAIEDRACTGVGVHDVHLYESGGAWHRCRGVACDHEHLCCSRHDVHVLPHRGCPLR